MKARYNIDNGCVEISSAAGELSIMCSEIEDMIKVIYSDDETYLLPSDITDENKKAVAMHEMGHGDEIVLADAHFPVRHHDHVLPQ